MNDNVRTRLELLNDGLNTQKRRYKKRKPSKKVESEQKSEVVDDVEDIPVEEQNIVFKPNRRDIKQSFLLLLKEKCCMVVVQVVVSHMQC